MRAVMKFSVVLLGLVVLAQPTVSYAWGNDHFDRRDRYYRYHDHPRSGLRIELIQNDYVPVTAGGARYYYYDGLYYVPTPNGYVLVTPPIGAVVRAIPADFRPVIINGMEYFTDSGIYYVRVRYGYQVVPPPVVQRISEPVVMTQTVQTVRVVPEPQNQTKVAEGATLGGILGAVAGGIIGHQEKGHHELGGALLGGAAGAVVGGVVGAQIPNQDEPRTMTVVQPVEVAMAPLPVAPLSAVVAPQASDETFTVNVPSSQGGYIPVTLKRSGSGFTGPQGEYYPEFPKVAQLQMMYSK